MVIRPRQRLLASTTVALVAVAYGAAPVVVTDYDQLVGTIGSNNIYETGERFDRYMQLYTNIHQV